MSNLLRQLLAAGGRLSTYWLCWVIYATEIGYRYTGDEYWQSFEELTPGWGFHHRDALRSWFRKFQTSFNGVVPSGAWAGHFLNIAWPITHAVLPKYLQHQFAYATYQLRFRLAGLDSLDSRSVGGLLADNAYDASTRFQQFLQQEELTGRILLGLLGITSQDGPEPIYQPTLKRIISDLDHVRTARAWLKETRTVVDRFQGIGHGSGIAHPRPASDGRDRAAAPQNQFDIRPRVFLRHSGGGKWAVAVEVPSFAPVAALRGDLRAFLRETRCRFASAHDMKPAGWILSSNRVAILKSWPQPGVPLVTFEKKNTVLDHLLQSECVLSTGTFWLFRIGPDGIAREITGRTVRPEFDYIVLTSKAVLPVNPLVKDCAVECSDIHAFRISIPSSVSAEQTQWLSGLGLQIARTIRVWPAGLPCRNWDGEGHSEWLTTEDPCFGIFHDHPVSAYEIRINGNVAATINAPLPGTPIFLRLNRLAAGQYRVTVTAKRHGSIADIAQRSSPEGFVHLVVREPEPWIPGTPAHTGLVVTMDPHDADLDELWGNKVAVSIAGPDSHKVTCLMVLEKSDGEELLSEQIGPALPLPVTADVWRKKFGAFVKTEDESHWRSPAAASGRLHVRGEELGEFVVRFDRHLQPLRWITRRQDNSVLLKLLDDSGLPDEADCRAFSMRKPATPIAASTGGSLAGFTAESPGALYVAQHGDHKDVLLVSQGFTGTGLRDLGVVPDCGEIDRGDITLANALLTQELWIRARLVGPLAEIRRTQVTKRLATAIYARLCGRNWAIAERTFEENGNTPAIDALQQRIDAIGSFGAVLKQDHAKFLGDVSESTAWYDVLARRYKVTTDRRMSEFAVRLAFLPQTLSRRFGSDLDELAKEAVSNVQVVRGARFAALLCAQLARAEWERFAGSQRWA